MPEPTPERPIASMQNLITRMAGAIHNTHIKGSATGAAGSSEPPKKPRKQSDR